MPKQIIQHGVATRLTDAPQYIVEQRSGHSSWVDVREDGGLTLGPAYEWRVYMSSGGTLNEST